jgi:branched-chain amino acid aminotransferase
MAMITELPSQARRTAGFEAQGIAYFDRRFVPLDEATISIATHAFNYGTGCFEGIRGYWNPQHEELYLVKLVEHFERLEGNARVLHMKLPMGAGQLCDMAVELLRRNGYREDVYLRPIVYKASSVIKVGLLGLVDGFCCFTAPMGDYHDVRRGLSVTVSGWRRNSDDAIPPRSKATGGYLNAALAVADAQAGGYDEAILLTGDGQVSEASAANLFLVHDGELVTPDEASDILPGITRRTVMELAGRLHIPASERRVDRTELYTASELFLCGTGVQIVPITSVDGRAVGSGEIGDVTRAVQSLYLAAVRGEVEEFRNWLTPVYAHPEDRPVLRRAASRHAHGGLADNGPR